jgi:antiphage defense system Thoeris ThsB-like protein
MAGINRALDESLAKSRSGTIPCIFLSHIAIDKTSAVVIGQYVMQHGDIDIYLDVNDPDLQAAAVNNDAKRVTRFIERGLSRSTHIMCLISTVTVKSWWVPYELGFAKSAGKHLSTLKLQGDVELPAFLEISEIIRGTKTLNQYLSEVRSGLTRASGTTTLTKSLIEHYILTHPLDKYLDFNS